MQAFGQHTPAAAMPTTPQAHQRVATSPATPSNWHQNETTVSKRYSKAPFSSQHRHQLPLHNGLPQTDPDPDGLVAADHLEPAVTDLTGIHAHITTCVCACTPPAVTISGCMASKCHAHAWRHAIILLLVTLELAAFVLLGLVAMTVGDCTQHSNKHSTANACPRDVAHQAWRRRARGHSPGQLALHGTQGSMQGSDTTQAGRWWVHATNTPAAWNNCWIVPHVTQPTRASHPANRVESPKPSDSRHPARERAATANVWTPAVVGQEAAARAPQAAVKDRATAWGGGLRWAIQDTDEPGQAVKTHQGSLAAGSQLGGSQRGGIGLGGTDRLLEGTALGGTLLP
ncbi:hypothetical protein HaLaN_03850 [Haematococcus lacustris]|uniref:Uncharacterized protein n=1 Tax=Haematococcus lacustris TaxID=44745 RepID=A0A699YRF3_HAELA|nr:hypothetical protein HaLaN_03850 [Haematococcus lacustris]